MPNPETQPTRAFCMPRTISIRFILGGPGSGKGTQTALLSRKLKWNARIDMGGLLREELSKFRRDESTKYGRIIAEALERGDILPGYITAQLMVERMKLLEPLLNGTPYLIDGFPRSMDNVSAFRQHYDTTTGTVVDDKVVHIRCSNEVMRQRLLKRATESAEARDDDTPEIIEKRLVGYETITLPVIEYYRDRDRLIEVDGDHGTPEDIHEEVLERVVRDFTTGL